MSYRWDDVTAKDGTVLLELYKVLLIHLGSSTSGASTRVQAIFANAGSTFRSPRNLAAAVQSVDGPPGGAAAHDPKPATRCRAVLRAPPRSPPWPAASRWIGAAPGLLGVLLDKAPDRDRSDPDAGHARFGAEAAGAGLSW